MGLSHALFSVALPNWPGDVKKESNCIVTKNIINAAAFQFHWMSLTWFYSWASWSQTPTQTSQVLPSKVGISMPDLTVLFSQTIHSKGCSGISCSRKNECRRRNNIRVIKIFARALKLALQSFQKVLFDWYFMSKLIRIRTNCMLLWLAYIFKRLLLWCYLHSFVPGLQNTNEM